MKVYAQCYLKIIIKKSLSRHLHALSEKKWVGKKIYYKFCCSNIHANKAQPQSRTDTGPQILSWICSTNTIKAYTCHLIEKQMLLDKPRLSSPSHLSSSCIADPLPEKPLAEPLASLPQQVSQLQLHRTLSTSPKSVRGFKRVFLLQYSAARRAILTSHQAQPSQSCSTALSPNAGTRFCP